MKKAILISGVAAVATLAGCTKENVVKPETNKTFEGDKAYVVVNIKDVGTSATRATDGGFVYGSANEYALNTASFFFYGKDGAFVTEAKVNTPSGSANEKDPAETIEYNVNTIITLNGLTSKAYPNWVVTVLNEPDGFTAPSTLDAFAGLLADETGLGITVQKGGTTYYTMTTSSYVGGDNEYSGYYFATPVVDANFALEGLTGDDQKGYTAADGKDVAPIDIYVERLAAKVCLTTSMEATNNLYKLEGVEESDDEGVSSQKAVYIRFDGWKLNCTAKYSNLMKTIRNTAKWNDEYFGNGFAWNDATNFRSYWGESFNYGLGTASDYPNTSGGSYEGTTLNPYLDYTNLQGKLNTVGGTTLDYVYCAENTNTAGVPDDQNAIINNNKSSAITDILLKATICGENGESLGDMVRCDGLLYTKENFLAYALSHVSYYIQTAVAGEGGAAEDKYEKIPATYVDLGNLNDGYVKVALKKDYENTNFYTFNTNNTDDQGNLIPDKDPINPDEYKKYTADDVNTDLDERFNNSYGSDANAFTGGEMYYSIPIEHLNNDYTQNYLDNNNVKREKVLEANYGIVRNHIYFVTITGLENLGHGIYDPDEVIVPQPDVDTYAIAADIHILAWKQVNQSIVL